MRKKRIVQYCCVVLVAAGIGLNIQNAIADYGMNRNTLSLVADCTTYATGGTLGWCSYADLSNIYSNTYSNGYEIEKEGVIEQCCDKAGRWRMVFYRLSDGTEYWLRGTKLTYQRWRYYFTKKVIVTNPDGTTTEERHRINICQEYPGGEASDCPYVGGMEDVGID